MAGTGGRNDRGHAFLAPGASRYDRNGYAPHRQNRCRRLVTWPLSYFSVSVSSPFIDQCLSAPSPGTAAFRGNAKLSQLPAHRVPGQAELPCSWFDQFGHHLPNPQCEVEI